MICGSGESKRVSAEPAGQMRDTKLHAVVAQGTFRSQNEQSIRGLDHFWKLRCRKSARRCGAKHISKWNCTKYIMLGPLLEFEMSKKCTPLWREAHFEVKLYKIHHARTTFGIWDVEKVHAVVARSTCRSENVQSIRGPDHFWKLRCRKRPRRCGAKHISKWTCQKHRGFGPLLEVQMSLRVAGARDCAPCQKWAKREGFVAFSTTTTTTPHYTPIHYITLQLQLHFHYVLLHYTPLHYTALKYIQLRNTTLHYATLQSTTLHYTALHYLPLHLTTSYYTALHNTTTTTTQLHNYTPPHSTTLHCTKLHSTTLNYTTLHYITLHYTPLHYITLHDTTFY